MIYPMQCNTRFQSPLAYIQRVTFLQSLSRNMSATLWSFQLHEILRYSCSGQYSFRRMAEDYHITAERHFLFQNKSAQNPSPFGPHVSIQSILRKYPQEAHQDQTYITAVFLPSCKVNHKVLVDLENLCGGDSRRSFIELQTGETREAKVCIPSK